MLDFIPPSGLTYDDWLAVGMALKNNSCDCGDWEQWSRSDDRFKDGECESKWQGFNRDGYDFGTIFMFAHQNGYDAKDTMAAMKKDVDANKRFIDSAKDTRRQAYARRATTIPRHCVFVITTNNKMCLTDMTGNRRYPIIVCHKKVRHFVESLTDNAVEIYNNCFGNDKRKSPTRINEILNRIDGWNLGGDIFKTAPAYLRQRKVFYREEN